MNEYRSPERNGPEGERTFEIVAVDDQLAEQPHAGAFGSAGPRRLCRLPPMPERRSG
jgi:hypothetical protein